MTLVAAPPRTCPKCAAECAADRPDCPFCGVFFDKAEQADKRLREQESRARGALGDSFSIERLATVDRLLIRQQVERLEAWTGWEVANSYVVQDELGNVLFHVAEESGTWVRQLLKSMRPFTMHVTAPDGQTLLTLRRPYRWYFAELDVHDADGSLLGSIRKRFSFVNKCYELHATRGGGKLEIVGPFWRPWTFHIRRGADEVGTVRKQWSGLAREIFTDADTFGVEFPRELDVRLKAAFLGAVFLIDIMHFEDDGND